MPALDTRIYCTCDFKLAKKTEDEHMDKKVEYYMNLPYTIEMRQEPEGGWFVRIKELRG